MLAQSASGGDFIKQFLCTFLYIYYFVLLARIILSWLPSPPDALRPIVNFIYGVTEPILSRLRPLIPPLRIGMVALDLSVLLVFLLLTILQTAVCSP